MSMITMDKGKIYIPVADIIKVMKPKAGELKDKLHSVLPGAQYDSKRGCWYIFASPDAVRVVNRYFGVLLEPPASTYKSTISSFPFVTKPREHQMEALETCAGREYFAYFMEPGLGKTKVAIDDYQILNQSGKVSDVLVTSPKSVMGTWVRQLHDHGHWKQWAIYRWNNDVKTPRVDCIYSPQDEEDISMRWFIMGIDSILADSRGWRAAWQFMMRSIQCGMIVDESTTIKNITTQRTIQAMTLGEQARYRRILSGSPIANTPLDYYSQMVYLDESIFYGWSYSAFRGHYAITGGYKQREIYGYTNQDELAAIVAQHSIIKTKAECLDLPPRVFQIREITLSKATWKMYDAIVNDTIYDLEETKKSGIKVTVDMVTKKLMKLRQLTGGQILGDVEDDGSKPVIPVGKEKMSDLLEFMDECRAVKTIVWCQFTHEIDIVAKALSDAGFVVVKYDGRMNSRQRDKAEDDFERGGANVAVIQNDTGGMGLTLNAASVCFIYSNPSYPLPRIQLTERNYRDGQTKSTTVVDTIAVGTIDQTLYDSLMSKMSINDAISTAVKSGDFSTLKGVLYPKKMGEGWKGKPLEEREEDGNGH